MTSQEKAKQLIAHIMERVKTEERITELNKHINQLENELNETMTDEGVDAITVDGIEFKPDQKISFSIAPTTGEKTWDCDMFFKWLRQEHLGDLIKSRESVHHQTRVKVLSDRYAAGEPLPDWVDVKFYDTVKYSKSAVERMAKK